MAARVAAYVTDVNGREVVVQLFIIVALADFTVAIGKWKVQHKLSFYYT
jgi:hypothetical protein